MLTNNPWPAQPICKCGEWHDGFVTGHLQGVRDGRAELIAEQLEQQRRAAEKIEPANSVIGGLRALRARTGGGGADGHA